MMNSDSLDKQSDHKTVGLISSNNITYENITKLKDDIKSKISTICKFNKRDTSNIKNVINYIFENVKIIDNENEYIQTQELITYFNKKNNKYVNEKYYLFYPIYLESTIEHYNLQRNYIGEYLINHKENIYGDAIIIKVNNEKYEKDEKIIDITDNDLYRLIKHSYFHKSIVINSKNNISAHYFTNNPAYNFSKFDNSVYEQINFMEFTIELYFSMKDKHKITENKDKLNKYGTIIKKYSSNDELFPIYGPIMVTLQKEGEYIYLNKQLLNNIMKIISNVSKNKIGNNIDLFNTIELNEICLTIPDDVINRPSLNSLLKMKK